MNLELRQLRYFVAIVEAGSLSAAARLLHIAQPALTHHLKHLEAEFGRPLLIRGARGIRPTAEGERLFRHALGVLRHVAGLRAAVSSDGSSISGVVAVGLPPTVAGLLSLPLYESVQARHPGIRLELVGGHSRDLGRALLEGQIDLALMMPPGPGQGVVEQLLLDEELFFICPPKAPWLPPGSAVIGQDDLPRLPLLLSSRADRLYRLLAQRMSEDRIELDVRGHLDDIGSLLAAVEAGHGATVLPWCTAADALLGGRLVARRMPGRMLMRKLILCRPDGTALREATGAVAVGLLSLVGHLIGSGRWPATQAICLSADQFLATLANPGAEGPPSGGPNLPRPQDFEQGDGWVQVRASAP
jgi:LysR family nitrogen assimilation transcriptional regulator